MEHGAISKRGARLAFLDRSAEAIHAAALKKTTIVVGVHPTSAHNIEPVPDNIENLMLEHFRAIRAEIATLAKVVGDVVLHLQAIEQAIASIKVEIGQHHSEISP